MDFDILPLAAYIDLVWDPDRDSKGRGDGFCLIFEEKPPRRSQHASEVVRNVFNHHRTALEPKRSRYGNSRALKGRFLAKSSRFGSTMMKPIVDRDGN